MTILKFTCDHGFESEALELEQILDWVRECPHMLLSDDEWDQLPDEAALLKYHPAEEAFLAAVRAHDRCSCDTLVGRTLLGKHKFGTIMGIDIFTDGPEN